MLSQPSAPESNLGSLMSQVKLPSSSLITRLTRPQPFRPISGWSDADLLNETFRRVAVAFEKVPKLELHNTSMTAGLHNLQSLLVAEQKNSSACQQRLAAAEAALHTYVGLEAELNAFRESNRDLQQDLANERDAHGLLKAQCNDLRHIKREKEKALKTSASEIEALQARAREAFEENFALQEKITKLDLKLLEQGESWHQEYLRAEDLQQQLSALKRDPQRDPASLRQSTRSVSGARSRKTRRGGRHSLPSAIEENAQGQSQAKDQPAEPFSSNDTGLVSDNGLMEEDPVFVLEDIEGQ